MCDWEKLDMDCRDFGRKMAEWADMTNNSDVPNNDEHTFVGDFDWLKFDAVIFDMDGTLVNSMYYWEHLTDEWFARQGMSVPGILVHELATADLWQAAELLAAKYAKEQTCTQAVFDELQAKMDRHYALDIELLPGRLSWLEMLAAAGKKACIATMTERPQVETMLKRHEIGEYFRFVLTTPEVGKGKTQPDIFLQAAERMGVPVAKTLVVEDSGTAIKTALAAGFNVLVIRQPGYNYSEIEQLANKTGVRIWYWQDDVAAVG